jgi:hypothetical protein
VAWLIAESLSQDSQASLDLAHQALDMARHAAPTSAWAAELAVLRALDATGDVESVQSAIETAGAIAWEEIDARDELLIEVLQCLTVWTPNQAPWLNRALGRIHELAHLHTMAATPLASLAIGDVAFTEAGQVSAREARRVFGRERARRKRCDVLENIVDSQEGLDPRRISVELLRRPEEVLDREAIEGAFPFGVRRGLEEAARVAGKLDRKVS